MTSSLETGAKSPPDEFSTLFNFLPIGAYRASPDGMPVRVNPALARLNGYADEAEMLAAVRGSTGRDAMERSWYVEPERRELFRALLERDGQVTGFVSQIHRHKTRERIWISENAHIVRDPDGAVLYYEGTIEEVTERIETERALQRSEDLLRQLTAHVPGVVYRMRIDHDGGRHYEYVSPGVRALFGVEPQAVLDDGTLLRRLVHPDDHEWVERTAPGLAAPPLEAEFRVLRPDGEVRWAHLSSARVAEDDQGTVRVGVMVDITARKEAEAALRASDERWKLALESSGDGVWDWDLRTGVETLSARCREMYGLDAGEGAHRPEDLDQRTHPDDVARMLGDRQAHLEGRAPRYQNEHRIRCADGSWKWVLTRGLVIARDEQGRPLRMIGTHTDITARKEADALRQERDRADAADRAKTLLLSRVSHELRTPLNAVLGFAQLIENDSGVDPRHLVWVRHIRAGGNHLLELVDDLLDLASAQAGRLHLNLVAVDLAPLLTECWHMQAAAATRQQLRWAPEFLGEPDLSVRADVRRLRQVVGNLLSNAIKYNLGGGEVRVTASRHADRVSFSVHNTGRGLDADQLARIFSPFERLGAQHTTVEGTGLGLALTKELVEAMGGSIDVDSRPGAGACFTVQLPAAR